MEQIGQKQKADEQNRVKPWPKDGSAREILSIATGCGEPPAAEVRPGREATASSLPG